MKKLLLIATILFSQYALAEANTSAKLEQDWPYILKNIPVTFWSSHEYTVSNNTPLTQHVSVCFDIVSCPEYAQWVRNTRDCRSFDLAPYQTKTEHKSINLTVNYPFNGWCHIYAQTETTGGTYSKSQDIKQFQVK